ncbi:MAG TPA: hypothetical protein VLL27_11240 [Solirubrobacterales bacterium]|nr:hypothetical protein [Solirubrobacterales bacterium]
MTIRRTIVGLCMLCALAASAFAAQGAVAKGTTAFTCKKTEKGGAGFSKAHCKAADAVGSGAAYEHVAIAPGTTTEISGTNSGTGSNTESTVPVKLKNTQNGVTYEIQAGKVSGIGSVTNAVEGEEHYVHGVAVVTFEELTLNPGSCEVEGGKITSKELKVTTKGQGDFVKFEPAAGSVMTEYTLKGCSPASLNGVQEVTGSIKCPADGATISCTHNATTELGTLKERTFKSGVEGSMTLKAKDPAAGDKEFTALSVTT